MSLLPVSLTGLVPASVEQYTDDDDDDDDDCFYIALFSALEQTHFHIPSPFVLTLYHRIVEHRQANAHYKDLISIK